MREPTALPRRTVAEGEIADVILSMIASGKLYVDLEHELVDEPKKCHIYSNELDSKTRKRFEPVLPPFARPVEIAPGAILEWDGRLWEVVNQGKASVALKSEPDARGSVRVQEIPNSSLITLIANGSIRAIGILDDSKVQAAVRKLAEAGPAQREVAWRRFEAIREALAGVVRPSDLTRNQRRWYYAFRAEEKSSRHGMAALLPEIRPGNRTHHEAPVADSVIDDAIDRLYAVPHQPSKLGLVRRLFNELITAGVPRDHLPSQKRCRRRIALRSTHEQDLVRLGSRAAYESKSFYWTLSASTPPHGVRPWEVCHIDHTELDIELVDSEDPDVVLGRPWLTILMDAYSRRVIAFWLTFDPPSYRSDLMIFRLCVRTHSRLPDSIVTDGGSDFESNYYESLCANTQVVKKTRPSGESHFGSVIERIFGITNVQFIHEVIGNTKATKRVRTLTKSVDPKRLAAWDLETLSEALAVWFYEIYENLPHSGIGKTPSDAFHRGVELAGARPSRFWPFGDDFVRLTMPSTKSEKLTIHRTKGLRFENRSYWNALFRQPRFSGLTVDVRFDPMDARYIEAFVDGSWIRCEEREFWGLGPTSEREVAIGTIEAKARKVALGRSDDISNIDLGGFLRDADEQSAVFVQRRKDREARKVAEAHGILTVVNASPSVAPPVSAEPDSEPSRAPKRFDIPLEDYEVYE